MVLIQKCIAIYLYGHNVSYEVVMEFGYIWNWIFGRKHSLINPQLNYRIALGLLISNFSDVTRALTHWGRVTPICASKLTIIGSDNGLSPGRHQAIIWTNAGILLIRTLGTNFSEIIGEIHFFFHSRKCIWKCRLRIGVYLVSASVS